MNIRAFLIFLYSNEQLTFALFQTIPVLEKKRTLRRKKADTRFGKGWLRRGIQRFFPQTQVFPGAAFVTWSLCSEQVSRLVGGEGRCKHLTNAQTLLQDTHSVLRKELSPQLTLFISLTFFTCLLPVNWSLPSHTITCTYPTPYAPYDWHYYSGCSLVKLAQRRGPEHIQAVLLAHQAL